MGWETRVLNTLAKWASLVSASPHCKSPCRVVLIDILQVANSFAQLPTSLSHKRQQISMRLRNGYRLLSNSQPDGFDRADAHDDFELEIANDEYED